MEAISKCKDHGATIRMFCEECKALLCSKCLSAHKKKGCQCPEELFVYAKQNVLPKYENQLRSLDQRNDEMEVVHKAFGTSTKALKEELIQLKKRLELLLLNVENAIDLLDVDEDEFTAAESLKDKFMQQYEEFKSAIENEDTAYVVGKFDAEVSGGELQDFKKLQAGIENISAVCKPAFKELGILNELLEKFEKKYKALDLDSGLNNSGNYIYGVCYQRSYFTILCKYDISTKKLISSITVPLGCKTLEINRRIFISGGRNSCVNTLSELIDDKLVPKESMKYAKVYHGACVIDKYCFATVGGRNDNNLPYCEEYLIKENIWKELPSLNKARCGAGAAFLHKRFLYAIGGHNSNNTIEVLNYSTKNLWTVINISSDELQISASPAAFPISNSEIMILAGNMDTNVGILNTNDDTVKKLPLSTIPDYYYHNTIFMRRKKAYIISHNGNIHIYNITTKTFEDVPYADANP